MLSSANTPTRLHQSNRGRQSSRFTDAVKNPHRGLSFNKIVRLPLADLTSVRMVRGPIPEHLELAQKQRRNRERSHKYFRIAQPDKPNNAFLVGRGVRNGGKQPTAID